MIKQYREVILYSYLSSNIGSEGVRGCVFLVPTRSVLETATANKLMCQKHPPKVWVLVRSFKGDELLEE